MHVRWTLAAAALALAAFSPRGSAQGANATTPGAAEGAAAGTGAGGKVSADRIEGKVVMVDANARELAIDAGDATTQVHVADDAKVTVDGKAAKLSDVAQGAEVRVSLDRKGDMPAASTIEVHHTKKK